LAALPHLAFLPDSCVVCILKVLHKALAADREVHPPAMAIAASLIGTSDNDPVAILSDAEGVLSVAVPAHVGPVPFAHTSRAYVADGNTHDLPT